MFLCTALLAAALLQQQAPATGGTVLFSGAPNAAPTNAATQATVPVTNATRQAVTFTAYVLDVHLSPQQTPSLAVQARVTVRNDGATPLAAVPLQLSSTLTFDEIRASGKRLPLSLQTLASDADHTGQVHEAAAQLEQPLAPGAALTLTIVYSGSVPPSAARLAGIGTPPDLARRSDWDQVGQDFVGLRGFGDVLWYPVAAVPVSLAEGATVFAEIGRQKLRNQDALVSMHLTQEFTGEPPNVAVLDGLVIESGPPSVTPTATFPGVANVDLPPTRLGFAPLSLIWVHRERVASPAGPLRVYAAPDHEASAEAYVSAASLVSPLLGEWLGKQPRAALSLIDLGPEYAPTQLGDAVVGALSPAPPSQLADALSSQLAHAWFPSSQSSRSPRAWLAEGVPSLMGILWTERTGSHEQALARLDSVRGALALAEPSSPGSGAGESLIDASLPVYYRAKATYVLWMLRALVGDKALGAALSAYDPAADTKPEYFEQLVEKAALAGGAAAGSTDLGWFFRDWVYRDQGLPDLSIANVYSSRSTQPDQWLVAVDIANDGYCETEVPVTVRSATTALTERVRVPARSKIAHRMLVTGQPTEVDLNDGTVPEVQASAHQRLLQ